MPAIGVDVIKQIIPGNPIRSGSRIAYVDKQGNISVLPPANGHNHIPVPSGVEARLTNRFPHWTEG